MTSLPKIAMLSYHQNNGGAAIACNRLVKSLRDAGAEVRHITQEGKSTEGVERTTLTAWDRLGNFIRFVAERLYFLPFEKNKSIRFLFNSGLFGRDLRTHPSIQSADIIHLHFTNFGFLSIKNIEQLCSLGKPVVWTLHDMWAFTGGCHHSGTCENYQSKCGFCTEFMQKPGINDLSHRLWERKIKAFRNPNLHIITCSHWLRHRAIKSSILKNQQIISIPNTLDLDQIFVPKHKKEAKLSLGLDPEKTLILFVAVRPNAPKKGFKQFIETVQFLENRTSIQIGIIGNVLDKTPFEAMNLPIHFFGHIQQSEKMATIYQSSDVYVTTSLEENLPNTIMEAMACGTPCVGFEVGGIPEMIEHLENGYVAKAFDVSDFAKGIQEVLANGQEMGEKARIKALNNYSEQVIAHKHLDFYQQCFQHV